MVRDPNAERVRIVLKTERLARSMTDFTGFSPAAPRFFRNLSKHNDKLWFEANRAVYETEVRDPLRAFVEAMDVALATRIPEITGDPKRSVFRINRDIRFSKDKSPYKTNAGCWFYHQDAGKGVGQEADSGGAGFYFHLDGKAPFVAGGIWMPARPALNRIRDAIAEDPKGFGKIVTTRAIVSRFGGLDQENRLTRVPRGFDAEHPAADWLRHQSFTLGRELPLAALESSKLVTTVIKDFVAMAPLVRWINAALGFKPALRRR